MLHILIADDHGIVRSGVRMLIDRQDGMHVVAEAEDGVDAVEAALREQPDVAVLDVAMPRMTGIQAAREIKAHCPGDLRRCCSRCTTTSATCTTPSKAGASGYVLKRAADADLVDAVRAVAAGRPFLSPTRRRRREVARPGEQGPRDPLTPRELDVVKLIAEAYTNKQIAEILQLSEKTVESHRANVLAKLGMRDRVELVRYAIRRGLIEP